ncbi:MAG TPA: hypothetical protein VEA40_15885 [Ramlibacter sp.]|nr:hypothetical protein [Ramlibacter sp.]
MKVTVSNACLVLALLAASQASAQGARIWRCGNTYTNDAAQAQAQGCKVVEGGNVTVVEGTRVQGAAPVRVAAAAQAAPAPAAAPGNSGQRVESAEQRARDSDARLILEAELKKAEARQAELAREWNNGEPEKLGPEHRNHQKYLDRVAELKASLARNESDIAGIRRELNRLAAPVSAAK